MDLEATLRESEGAETLEKAIAAQVKSFHGLLTREVAVRLIAKEKGLLKEEEKNYQLAEIPKDAKRFGFTAHVKKIWPVANYSSGKRSRVIEVSDQTATKPLLLWNQDVELAQGLRTKDQISVRGAYERGGELHLGYSGSLEVTSKAAFSDLASLEDNDEVHIRGVISKREGYDRFIPKSTSAGGRLCQGFAFFVSDGKSERRCIILEDVGRAEQLKEGDEIIIENSVVSNGSIEIKETSRIMTRRRSDMLIGELRKLEVEDEVKGAGNTRKENYRGAGSEDCRETLVVEVEGKEVRFDRQDALAFFGVTVADDIRLGTVAELKKEGLINTRIAVKIRPRSERSR